VSYVSGSEAEVTIPFHHAEAIREAVVVLGYDCTCDVADLEDWLDNCLSVFNDNFGDALDSQVTLGPARGRMRPPGVVDPIIASGSTTYSDGTTSNVAPSNCAVLFQKRTARGGRKGRGRMYLPWAVGEGQVTDTGILDPALVSSYNTRASDWLDTGVFTSDDHLRLLHTDLADGVSNVITSITCDSRLATQRRRLGR
jgi:hypothetical protein